MNAKFLSIDTVHEDIMGELNTAISRTVQSGTYILGTEVDEFEREFSAYCGVRFTTGVGSGLDALKLALLAVGVKPGHEVLVPTNTFIASWLAITQIGATPVPVEPCSITMNIDTDRIEPAITRRTKAIMPVHLYGEPADLRKISELARTKHLSVVEDAAQAHGARFLGKPIGSHSHAVAWSFYPAKNLGAMGDGGAVTTNDLDIANRVRLLRNYGSREKYTNEILGFNSRLDTLQAAILRVKLNYLDSWNSKRRSIASIYLDRLQTNEITLPATRDLESCAWHLFVIRVKERNGLRERLAELGVETGIHYPTPPHLQPAYRSLGYTRGSFPIAEQISEKCLSLPIGPHLKDGQAEKVCDAVLQCLR